MKQSKFSLYASFTSIATIVVLIDYITKKWALETLFLVPQKIVVTSFLNLVPVWNNGVSFGIMSTRPDIVRLVIPLLALVIVSIFIYQLSQQPRLIQIASAIISGGAIGNVIDRFLYGRVVDFFDFHAAGYHWPAFNIADIAISSGVAIWLYAMIIPSAIPGEKL